MKAEQGASAAALDAASNVEICFVDCLHTRCDMGETERNIALVPDAFAAQAGEWRW